MSVCSAFYFDNPAEENLRVGI